MNTTQSCPDIGTWRAWLDHETDLSDEAQHLETCPGCQRVVDELRDDAAFADAGLASLASSDLPSAADVSVARERVHWRHAATHKRSATAPIGRSRLEPTPMIFSRFSTPWRAAAGGVAAAIALTLVVAFTPAGSAAAAGFLAQFRSQQVQAIEITPQSQADISRALKALSNLGTIQEPAIAQSADPAAAAKAAADQSKTATAAEATKTVGFDLLTPDPKSLPSGVSSTPTIRVTPGSQIKFTFDKKKAQAYYQSTGHPEVSLPDKFDGASLSVSIPPAAVLSYSGGQGSRNEVIVAEAGELVVDTQGNVSLTEMRDFLLGLPGLPPAIVSQLKQIQNWNDTLPIPVPVDQVNWQKTTINGNSALLLNDNSGVGSAVVWHTSGQNGHLIGVAGTLKASDLQNVASTLAVR
jgi:hypothetical protein